MHICSHTFASSPPPTPRPTPTPQVSVRSSTGDALSLPATAPALVPILPNVNVATSPTLTATGTGSSVQEIPDATGFITLSSANAPGATFTYTLGNAAVFCSNCAGHVNLASAPRDVGLTLTITATAPNCSTTVVSYQIFIRSPLVSPSPPKPPTPPQPPPAVPPTIANFKVGPSLAGVLLEASVTWAAIPNAEVLTCLVVDKATGATFATIGGVDGAITPATTRSRLDVAGLTAKASYTFTLMANNAAGTVTASADYFVAGDAIAVQVGGMVGQGLTCLRRGCIWM